ncbi:MAG: hypothetical protein ACXWFO_06725, partial [Candidatus Aminicenantales bacterium]
MTVQKTIKFRLTVWYLVVIAVLLIGFGGVAYVLLSKNLYRNLDASLRARSEEIQKSIKFEGGTFLFDQKVDELVLIYDADRELKQRLGPNVEFETIGETVKQALFGNASFVSAETVEGPYVRLYAAPFNVDT